MAQPKEIKLFGAQHSAFSFLAHHTLRLKGVKYEYIQVDLNNKSEEFLKLNPVHKKVPTLVVDGKPIAESLVILQYIDETWPEPPLMPRDPYQRSKVRFWADFFYRKCVPELRTIKVTQGGETQAKAVVEFLNNLKTLEDGINKEVHSEGPFIHGFQPGLIDLILGGCYFRLKLIEQGLDGVKLLDDKKTPLLCEWMDEYAKLDFVRDTAELVSQRSDV
ncbi:hypothetical protein LUZ60_003100 [Juncus effusus]|nr:hypothetical protein LUZ60_003100 [Juncus effusus]